MSLRHHRMMGISLNSNLIPLLLLSLPFLTLAVPADAQVSADGSLSTTVTQAGLTYTITKGDRIGNNLFHSFSQFSIPTGGSASFNNALDVVNIISRVTGGSVSNIDGLIQANGSANLFLINPAGMIFGSNARLNIGGSFIGSTASSLKFADGTEFSATPSVAAPLLSINTPIGLQMGQSSGMIQVQGTGNDGIVPTLNLGFLSSPGKTIALVGSDVSFTGGVITAPAGRIEVGAVNSGTVSLTPIAAGWQLGYAQAQGLGGVNLTNRSSLWSPAPIGNPAGGIQVVGRDIRLDQSQIAAATTGSGTGGSISINAQRSLTLGGVNPNAGAPSAWIVSQVAPGATGNGGSVTVQAGNMALRDGAAIETLSLGAGAAGKIQVTANTISAQGAVPVNSPLIPSGNSSSRISSTAYQAGAGGNIHLVAQQISLTDSGQITTFVQPRAMGQGGNITVEVANDITANGVSLGNPIPSGIAAYTFGIGKGGDVSVSTGTLHLIDSGGVVALGARLAGIPGTGIGNVGDVTVVARRSIELVGTAPSSPTLVSSLVSSTVGAGNGGRVTVTTPVLSLEAGAIVGTSTLPVIGTFGDATQADRLGNSGNVTLKVSDRLTITGINPFTLGPSGVGTSTLGSGNAGQITIQTNQLVLQDGSTIGAFTAATGDAGEITIQAQDILIDGFNRLPSMIAASAALANPTTRQFYALPAFPTGSTGRVNIATENLTVRHGGEITVLNEGTGNAGQLAIQANTITLDQGKVTATTASGQGGEIDLQVQNLLLLRRGSQIVATAGGNGDGGNITIQAPVIAGFENSDIIANAVTGRGGNIQITTQGIFGLKFRPQLTPENDITASSEFGVNGTVQVNTLGIDPSQGLVPLASNFADSTNQVAQTCSAKQRRNSFVILGRGGLSPDPTEALNQTAVWTDEQEKIGSQGSGEHRSQSLYRHTRNEHLRKGRWGGGEMGRRNSMQKTIAKRQPTPTASRSTAQNPVQNSIVEATGWIQNADGSVSLVTDNAAIAMAIANLSCPIPRTLGEP